MVSSLPEDSSRGLTGTTGTSETARAVPVTASGTGQGLCSSPVPLTRSTPHTTGTRTEGCPTQATSRKRTAKTKAPLGEWPPPELALPDTIDAIERGRLGVGIDDDRETVEEIEIRLGGDYLHGVSRWSQFRRRSSSTIMGIVVPEMVLLPANRAGSGRVPSSNSRRTRQVSTPRSSAISRVLKMVGMVPPWLSV